ncbi:MAG: DNA-directed RNA polymerase subunit alpha [Candidatus Pacebacteria bacterium]|nr:DNA-directed RNA polymerase subunit alpha [Candidatus Paceibacterota bacterium]
MIPLPTSIKKKEISGNNAVFEIESLYPGYGVTIGNALRRVLLSSLTGAAITEVKIKNAPHEFSTLPGVKEDILHVLMNLKQLRFKMFSDDPQIAVLKAKGEKKVTGKDFEANPEVKLANPELFIATLTDKNSELEIEVKIEKGVGYKFSDAGEKKDIGVIGMDSVFTPIKKANYTIESMRVGKRTDFDKINLEIETDGTISPEEALGESLSILISHFDFLYNGLELKPAETAEIKEEGAAPKKKAAKKTAKKKEK